ncbi:hypothetical protein BCV72DRAFT_198671 [Rhizopus microsporus var. microsporus]|uniref:DUF7905 domain-containing protein n=2 Tax=Rhizopus microsporus TaxID=58291 RepID=A0A2G4T7A3_RHIZD|nr:uncharacterized protein RHIMIDRAFT_232339 [Rhizopus microsporus ATCC 52813]ORE10903.1 hypothetical protein BCV72DRAFT_198671 [Rhizopus microsporus var. microsporus]PHZ16893.1 hypothetical protein RHIMIDRAFT_232339 [Rhizopus microsporus ATCC 52813]
MSDPFKGQEDLSDDDDHWRDPHIGETLAPSTRFSNTFDDSSTLVSGRSSRASTAMESFVSVRPSGKPDDYWVLPPHCTITDILGPGRARFKEMMRSTGAYMSYNDTLHQIDLWGDPLCIDKAKHSLNMIANRIAELDVTLLRKTKKWSRPDRELTIEEKRREEKRQQRILEEKKYLGEPTEKLPYYSVYYSPSDAVSINRIVGNNDSYLNQIRIDCKTYIEYDAQNRIFRLYSNDEANIKAASARLRNWHLRCCREPEAGVARLMQQPSANLALKYRKLPPDFVLYDYIPPHREQELRDRSRMFETITTGFEANIAYWNASVEDSLISLNDSQQMRGALSEKAKTLDKRNEEVIQRLLDRGLESIRLKDWDIRMKIRFGTIYLVDYPKKDQMHLTIEEVSDNMFKKKRFKSALAPCMSKSLENLDMLFEYLGTKAQEFSENPKTSFVILAHQYPIAASPADLRKKDVNRGEMWKTRTEVAFTDKGERGLWSTVTQCTDLVDISCFNAEQPYSWDLKVQFARSLPYDDVNAPHEKFSKNLKLSPSGRLIMTPVFDYNPKIVKQKTKWRYSWYDFTIEICQEELWDLNEIKREDKTLPLDFSEFKPNHKQFKISMYKEQWVDRFAENLRLGVGEAPSWTIRDFLGTEEENVHTIVHNAKQFGQILASVVPVYFEQSAASLV